MGLSASSSSSSRARSLVQAVAAILLLLLLSAVAAAAPQQQGAQARGGDEAVAAVSTAADSAAAAASNQAAYDGYGDTCRHDWELCSRARQCCSGTCLRHTCWSDPHHHPPCRERSERCVDSDDCCSDLVCGAVSGHSHPVCHNRAPPPDLCSAVTCSAPECQAPGDCDPATGTCSPPTDVANGTLCSGGSCQAGTCTDLCVRGAVNCSATLTDPECQESTCNPATGTCSAPTDVANGTACSVGICLSGSCAVACTGQPSAVANVTWTCPDTLAGGSCSKSCDIGTKGSFTAACNSTGGWEEPVGNCSLLKVVVLFSTVADTTAEEVQNTLNATGKFAVVGTWKGGGLVQGGGLVTPGTTPPLSELQKYDAVLAFAGAGSSKWASATDVGDVLALYWNGGGGVVVASTANVNNLGDNDIQGAWQSGDFQLLRQGNVVLTNESQPLILNPAEVAAGSPLLVGVQNLTADTAVRSTGTPVAGAVVVAQWGSGAPLIIRGEKSGRNLVELNMCPPSSAAFTNFWVGDGAAIMANALQFSITAAAAP